MYLTANIKNCMSSIYKRYIFPNSSESVCKIETIFFVFHFSLSHKGNHIKFSDYTIVTPYPPHDFTQHNKPPSNKSSHTFHQKGISHVNRAISERDNNAYADWWWHPFVCIITLRFKDLLVAPRAWTFCDWKCIIQWNLFPHTFWSWQVNMWNILNIHSVSHMLGNTIIPKTYMIEFLKLI